MTSLAVPGSALTTGPPPPPPCLGCAAVRPPVSRRQSGAGTAGLTPPVVRASSVSTSRGRAGDTASLNTRLQMDRWEIARDNIAHLNCLPYLNIHLAFYGASAVTILSHIVQATSWHFNGTFL